MTQREPAVRAAPGRPRSESARRAVLDAARILFERGGYHAASIEAIAARSGVAKTTIYRWWPNRAALLVALLVEVGSASRLPPLPEGKDPIRALRAELRLIVTSMNGLGGQLARSLATEAHNNDTVRTA